ncbi:MAG: restriction endonuclease subunit S [Chitinophagales bacterium]|nr:restriction endonuclease subunit S [Chitinophagales bacterium]
MKKYPKMKPSGVEWIGEVPEHWEVARYKYFYRSGMGETILKEDLVEEGTIPVFSATEQDEIFGFVNTAKLLLGKGDFVIPARGNSIGHIMEVQEKCTCTQTTIYSRKTNAEIQTRFTFHFLKGLKPHLFQFDRTAIPQITVQQVGNNPFLLPPAAEQTAIAHYLDRKTAQINQAISEKERLIELFREERQAIINHAVTKGIRAGVKMKASGVEWIGDVPEGWALSKFKYYVRTKARLGWKGLKAEEYVESGYGFLSTPNIKGIEIDFEKINFITEERYQESPEIMLEEGDVLLAKDGSTLGIVNLVKTLPFPCTVNSSIAVLRVFEKTELLPSFLKYFIESDFCQNVIQNLKAGMGVPHLFQADINNFEILLPPIQEQTAITSYVNQKTTQIDAAISGIQQEIALLQEYRQALIFEAVTGKICLIN